MKKILCLFMVLTLSLAIAAPAFATTSASKVIYTEDTEFNEVKKSSSGAYAVYVPASTPGTVDQYLPVGRLDISVDSLVRSNDILVNANLEPETKAYIEKLKDQALQDGSMETKITVFSPDLLPGTRDGNTTEFYYTHSSGRPMKGEYVYAYDCERHVTHVKGTTASAVADTLYNLGIIGAGLAPPPISFIAAGVSLLDYFMSTTGLTAIGGTDDWCYMDIKYDSFTQFTYDYNGTSDWCLLLTTQKVLVERIVNKQHYKVNASTYRSVDSTIYPNVTYMTPNFLNPWDKALASAPYGDSEVLSFEFAGRTFYY